VGSPGGTKKRSGGRLFVPFFSGVVRGAVLQGVFEISWRNVVVICGEVVVNCVVNVVNLRTLFDHRKTGHLFQLYFQVGILRLEGSPKAERRRRQSAWNYD